jgi:predicted cupin superfamily sugar epimerase
LTSQSSDEYSLCGYTAAPVFDFAYFEMGDYKQLTSLFPQHEKLIKEFTRG